MPIDAVLHLKDGIYEINAISDYDSSGTHPTLTKTTIRYSFVISLARMRNRSQQSSRA